MHAEGKDIRVKLGTNKKEHAIAGLKKVKEIFEQFKKDGRDERHKVLAVMKKLSKVVPEDQMKAMDGEINDLLKDAEQKAKEACDAKEKELNSA